jgi:hypothetical protein
MMTVWSVLTVRVRNSLRAEATGEVVNYLDTRREDGTAIAAR